MPSTLGRRVPQPCSPAFCNKQGKHCQKEHLDLGVGEKDGLGLDLFSH